MASDLNTDTVLQPLTLSESDKKPEKDGAQTNDDNADDYIVPDGGWGWVVTVACFITQFIVDGVIASFGVIYVELLHYFNETGGKTATAAALIYGIPMILAPVNCALITKFGFKIIAFIGGIMYAIAYIFSSLSPSLDVLIALLGSFAALGVQMCYTSGLLCLTNHFDKKRGLVTGLGWSGSGLGTLAFPPMVEFWMDIYTWRGACLLLGGVCLHLLPCSLVFRQLEKKPVPPQEQEALLNAEKDEDAMNSSGRMSRSMMDLPGVEKTVKKKLHNSDPAISQNVLNTTDNNKTPEFIGASHHGGYAVASSMASLYDKEKTTKGSDKKEERQSLMDMFISFMKSTIDVSLFGNVGFMLFGLSNFLLFAYLGLPYVYIPHMVQLVGIGEQEASFLLSIIGFSTTSQIALGFFADKSRASPEIYIVCMIATGGALFAMPYFAANYGMMCFLCVINGIGFGANYALTTLILIDLLGLEKLNVGFGMLSLMQGVGSLLGTPIGGWVYDATGGYYWAFISAGICVFISGVAFIPAALLLRNKLPCKGQPQSDPPVVELAA